MNRKRSLFILMLIILFTGSLFAQDTDGNYLFLDVSF